MSKLFAIGRKSALLLLALPLLSLSGCIYHPLFKFDSSSDSQEIRADASASVQPAKLALASKPVKKLPDPVLEMTPEVKREMEFLSRGGFIEHALVLRDEHYPKMTEIFEQEGIPTDVINLAMIESGFRPDAKSNMGAVGMWQMMKETAKLYGLRVGFFEDQRRDPILSTVAAARHLRDLYFAFNDWHLALAAYNTGAANVDRAMIKTGSSNFWQLARSGHLRQETARFVPRFIAACLLVHAKENRTLQADAKLLPSRLG